MDAVAKDEGRALREKCALPDYGQLVMDKFTERVAREIPVWPRMVIETTPLKMGTLPWPMLEGSSPAPKYEYKSSNILSFEVELISLVHAALTGHDTLYAFTVAEMHSHDGELIWKKRYEYSQKNVEATDCKLVKDGFDAAAKKTIDEFIDYIKRIYHVR